LVARELRVELTRTRQISVEGGGEQSHGGEFIFSSEIPMF
jgi:hypothetical protein